MTNVITDAGTDAKIAKFFKRGLEIMGLAMFEPVEVYGKYVWTPEGGFISGVSGFGLPGHTGISPTSELSPVLEVA